MMTHVRQDTRAEPAISVVVCTYNPRTDYLAETLAHLGAQRISEDWEALVVDNNSEPPLDADALSRMAGRAVRLVREPRQGLTYARCAGIAAAEARLLCFVDDDNFLDPDYLAAAVEIARARPGLGAFGGKAHGRLETEPDALVRHYLPFLGVRDLGDEPMVGTGAHWEPWEPIGAGLVVRRDVATAFADFVDRTDGAFGLGRTGEALLSGEDSLISRIADRLGYQVGYFPDLSLAHAMPADRLTRDYVFRLLEGHGRTHVILEAIAGRPPRNPPNGPLWLTLAERFAHRIRSPGLAEARGHWRWDRGFFTESARPLARRAAEQGPAALEAATASRTRERERSQ